MDRDQKTILKVVTVGDPACGRSVLLKYLKEKVYDNTLFSTMGVDFAVFDWQDTHKILMWDVGGQARFAATAQAYFRGANAVVVAIDSTSRETLAGANAWIQRFKDAGPDDNYKIIVLLTKCDRDQPRRMIFAEEFNEFATNVNADIHM